MDRRLRDELQEPFSQEDIHRGWSSLEARLPARGSDHTSWRPFLAFAFAGAAATAAVLFWLQPRPTPPPVASLVASEAGPLRRDGEATPLADFPGGTAGLRVQLSDRSEVRTEGPAALRLLENSGTRFGVKQLRGRVHYEVTPGGPRRWSIDCALATVEVIGTAFWVEADEKRVRVQVERGVVLVKGERVPERVQRLGGGEVIEIRADEPPPPGSAAPTASNAPAAGATPHDSASPTGRPANGAATNSAATNGGAADQGTAGPTTAWRELARRGAFKDAYAQLGPGGVSGAASQASTDELFALADVARYSGHPREALAPLEQIAGRGGAQGALAAFTLGRVRMDQLGDAGGAARDFERALALGLGGGLREDAEVRRIEALGRAGQRAQATEAAQALVARQPSLKARVAAWLPE
jgi:transmembrane sensor